ncbi:hypothetical protein [Sinomonas halotolerans]|uniref:Secreted protein n=1 Tax=Sinomonas halotolerans TaxID=1644133 RepID=A0ABU9X0L6_9MICC
MKSSKKLLAAAAAAALAVPLAASSASAATVQDDLAAVRAATAKYHDVNVALADGYTADVHCIPGMGIHYVNFASFGAPPDPLHPGALLYAPAPNGRLKLVAVEWFQVDADQDLTTDSDRPYFFGTAFDGPMPGHAPGMPIHYDLHAYIWSHNPDGVLTTWNPNITC